MKNFSKFSIFTSSKTKKTLFVTLVILTLFLSAPFFVYAIPTIPDKNFPFTDGNVETIDISNDGTTYVGGSFSKINNEAIPRVAVINRDGVLNKNWKLSWLDDPRVVVSSLKLSSDGNILYIGGNFTVQVNGREYKNLIAINKDGTFYNAWQGPNPDLEVTSIITSPIDNTIYIGGGFHKIGGTENIDYLAALNRDGSLDSIWTNRRPLPSSGILGMHLSPDYSTLYVLGEFDSIGNKPISNIAAINRSDGVLIETFRPNPNGQVLGIGISPDGETIFIGGRFQKVGALNLKYIAALNKSGIPANYWNSNRPTPDNNVHTIIVSPDGNYIFVGGGSGVGSTEFTPNKGELRNLAIINKDGTLNMTWKSNPIGAIYSMAFSPDRNYLYVGGSFVEISNDKTKSFLTRFSMDGQSPQTGNSSTPLQALSCSLVNLSEIHHPCINLMSIALLGSIFLIYSALRWKNSIVKRFSFIL